ncbi:MAG: FkbM family methyltransferase [Cytophagaceae bacterium]
MLKPALKKILLNLSPAAYKAWVFRALASFSWKTIGQHHLDPELLLLEDLLKDKNAVFLDIGANKGEFCFIAEKLIAGRNIYAFEPNPQLNRILSAIFPAVHVSPFAISDQTGSSILKVPVIGKNTDDSLGTLEISHKEEKETAQQTFHVQTITLDDFVHEQKIDRIDLIKIDVEGHEMAVMKGAGKTINAFRPHLMVEIEERHHRDQSIATLLKPYFDMGYNACYFSFSQLRLVEISNPGQVVQNLSDHGSRAYVNNFIFIHNKARFSSFIHEVNEKAGRARHD